MGTATIIGVDLAKNVFQLHGAAGDGSVVNAGAKTCHWAAQKSATLAI